MVCYLLFSKAHKWTLKRFRYSIQGVCFEFKKTNQTGISTKSDLNIFMYSIIKTLAVLIVATSLSLAQSSDQKTSLAVLDFIGRNISAADAVTLSDRFRFELLKTNKFSVMERNHMNLIFQEQNFQRSECDETCAVEAGQIAAVNKIITGAVTKFGKIYTVNIRMIDVATGKIDKETNNDCECKKEKLLTFIMKDAALKMAGFKENSSNDDFSSVKVITNIPGASLIIDGNSTERKTPVTIDSLLSGKHAIVASLGNLHAKKAVFVEKSTTKEVKLDLHETGSLLSIITNPANAEIFVDKKISNQHASGISSPSVIQTKPDEFTLDIFKPGYNDTSITFKSTRNGPEVLFVDLNPLDSKHSNKQMTILRHRKKSKTGMIISIPSFGICCGAAYLLYRSINYYDDAEDYKRLLNSSELKSGSAFDQIMKKNRDAALSGDNSKTAAMILGSAGLLGLTAGLTLYF